MVIFLPTQVSQVLRSEIGGYYNLFPVVTKIYFHSNTNMLLAFLTRSAFSLMVQMPWWVTDTTVTLA